MLRLPLSYGFVYSPKLTYIVVHISPGHDRHHPAVNLYILFTLSCTLYAQSFSGLLVEDHDIHSTSTEAFACQGHLFTSAATHTAHKTALLRL